MVSTAAVILFFKSGALTGCGGTNTLSFTWPQRKQSQGVKSGDRAGHFLSYSFISTSIYSSVHHTCEYNQLQNRSNHFGTPCTCCKKATAHIPTKANSENFGSSIMRLQADAELCMLILNFILPTPFIFLIIDHIPVLIYNFSYILYKYL